MKVLLITPTFSPDVGGVETMLSKFCDYLTKRKWQVNVITYCPLIVKTKAPFKEKLNEFITVWRIPWIGYGLFNIFERYPLIQFFYLVPAFLAKLISQKEKKGVSLFDREACREFALDNYSYRVLDWPGDSYDRARRIRFMSEN